MTQEVTEEVTQKVREENEKCFTLALREMGMSEEEIEEIFRMAAKLRSAEKE